jgi:Protochlamydia outer membrane protein
MYKFFIIFYLCFINSIVATITTPWEINISTGYREDHLKWRLQNPGQAFTTYREDYSDLKFMECELSLQKISRDVIFYVDAGYSFLGKDQMKQSGFDLDFTTAPVEFAFDTKTSASKGNAYLGYVVQLTPDRHYEVNIVPLFGFTLHYEKIKRNDPIPNPFESSQIENATSFTIRSNLSNKDFRQKWYGAFIGLSFFARPGGGKFSFNTGYRYNFLSFRQSFASAIFINTFNGEALVSQQERLMNAKASRNGNHGHFGYLKLSSYPSKYLKLSILGNIYYFSSETFTVNVNNQILNLFPTFSNITFTEAQKLKNRWLIFEVLMQLSFYL